MNWLTSGFSLENFFILILKLQNVSCLNSKLSGLFCTCVFAKYCWRLVVSWSTMYFFTVVLQASPMLASLCNSLHCTVQRFHNFFLSQGPTPTAKLLLVQEFDLLAGFLSCSLQDFKVSKSDLISIHEVLCLRSFLRLWKKKRVSRKPCKWRSDLVLNGQMRVPK